MYRRRLIAVLAGSAAVAAAPSSRAQQRLPEIVQTFAQRATPGQKQQLSEALAASPALTRQLEAAAGAGQLSAIDVGRARSLQTNPFLATVEGGRILLAPDFLDLVVARPVSAIGTRHDLLPNNLVFVLGSLVSHLQAVPVAATTDVQAFLQANLAKDARALIQGWNDVVDAAEHENGDRYLTAPQQLSLLMNLRYRSVFLDRGGARIGVWTSSGTIDPTDQNVEAIAAALRQANLLDFGVPPDLSIR